MDVNAAITHLESLGLYVDRRVPGGMSDGSPTDGITIARALVPQDGIHHLEDACFVFPLDGFWCYRNWNGIGGRAPDDVHIENLTLSTAVTYAEAFYFGAPLLLDGWIFPLNQHPDWDAGLLRASLDAAVRLSDAEWRRIRAERHAESKSMDDHYRFLAKFRDIPSDSSRNDDLRLWMRNDLGEMFIVRRP